MSLNNLEISVEEIAAFTKGFHENKNNTVGYDDSVKEGLQAFLKKRGLTKNVTKFGILILTNAYECGVGDGISDAKKGNPYPEDTVEHFSWQHGYEQGQRQNGIMDLPDEQVKEFFASREYALIVSLLKLVATKASHGVCAMTESNWMGNSARTLLLAIGEDVQQLPTTLLAMAEQSTLANEEFKKLLLGDGTIDMFVIASRSKRLADKGIFNINADDLQVDGEQKSIQVTEVDVGEFQIKGNHLVPDVTITSNKEE